VLNSSPDKHQVVWKVEEINLKEAEGLLHATAREFGGGPAATDATRVLRIPGFANKKYETNFCVEPRRASTETYHLRDFKLHIDSQDSPRRYYDNRTKRESSPRTSLSKSEHDWAFAKRAPARGEDPKGIIHQIAQHRAADKTNPEYYARHPVEKAIAELTRRPTQPRSNTFEDSPQAHGPEDPLFRWVMGSRLNAEPSLTCLAGDGRRGREWDLS
jgi:hypothetical protein